MLQSLLDWYKTTNKQPNLWLLARDSGVTKHPGDKPHTAKRKRFTVSRPPPETCSALQPTASAISPGNSPKPKQSSLQSVSVSASQSVTNLSFSPLNLQNSAVSISSEGGHANLYGYSYHSAYPPCSSYHSAYPPYSPYLYQTPMYPFPPLLPTTFSSQTPPYMTPHPEPTAKDSSPGPFTLKFINNRISVKGAKAR